MLRSPSSLKHPLPPEILLGTISCLLAFLSLCLPETVSWNQIFPIGSGSGNCRALQSQLRSQKDLGFRKGWDTITVILDTFGTLSKPVSYDWGNIYFKELF